MKTNSLATVVAASCVLLSLFARTDLAQEGEKPSLPKTLSKEAKAIDKTVRAYERAVARGDADALADLYTDNAVRMPPGDLSIVGKEAIRSWYREGLDKVSITEKITVDELTFGGTLAVCRISGRYTVTDKSTGKATPKRSISVFERQPNDEWKM